MSYRNLLLLATVLIIGGCDDLQTSIQDNNAGDNQDNRAAAEPTPAPAGKVLVTVNGSAITQDVLEVYAKTRKPQGGGEDANSPQVVLGELISLELMRQEGEKSNVVSKPIVIALLDQQRRSTLAGAAISDFMEANQTSDEEAMEAYNEKMGQTGKEYNARHILLKTQEQAVDVIASLDKGADFSELAMEKSTGPSGKSGGKLGWFAPGQMVKPFSDATAALEKDSYSKEPVETQFGWHVIILDDSRDLTPPPFDDVKERLKLLLANQKLQAHIQELKTAADIQLVGE